MKTTLDLEKHLALVRNNILQIILWLSQRGICHDQSKFSDIEIDAYLTIKDRISAVPFGSAEYETIKQEIQYAVDHHYQHNRHHPEHFKNGINDMNIVDLIEMFCDWVAANKRNPQNDVHHSIDVCCDKYKIPDMLKQIFHNSTELLT